MSKVFIEGMAMPKSCYECRFCRWISRFEPSKCEAITELTYLIKKEDIKNGRGYWCPLQEVKE